MRKGTPLGPGEGGATEKQAQEPRRRDTFDVIVVLGAKVRADGRPSAAMRRRIAHALDSWREGKAEVLLLSGGHGDHRPAEAEAMRGLALAAGVPEARIVLEPDSTSTLENAIYSARIMRERGWSSALVVTDRLHLPRALLAFRGTGIDAAGSGVKGGWREEPFRLWGYYLVHEAAALLWYAARMFVALRRLPRSRRD